MGQSMAANAGYRKLEGYLNEDAQRRLLADIRGVLAAAPLFTPTMPRTGRPMSVGMSNCGRLGWVTDKDRGYRYQATHPLTAAPWPAIPASLLALWQHVAGYPHAPEACLINYYAASARMGSHQDRDEEELDAPVVSVSLGDDALFHVGGTRRNEPKLRTVLRSGDVVVLGGGARLAFHGIDKILAGTSPLLAEGGRINLTLRRVRKPPE